MTKERDPSSTDPAEAMRQFFAEMKIADAHGIELLRLVRFLAVAYDAIMADRMRMDQITAPRWGLLMRLLAEERCGNIAVNPTHLSKTQRVSKNTVSAHLRGLEEMGLIERAVDPDDLRQFLIRLTDAGRSLIIQSSPGHMAFLNQLAGDLSADEIEQLLVLLRKLHGSLCRHGGFSECGQGGGPLQEESVG